MDKVEYSDRREAAAPPAVCAVHNGVRCINIGFVCDLAFDLAVLNAVPLYLILLIDNDTTSEEKR